MQAVLPKMPLMADGLGQVGWSTSNLVVVDNSAIGCKKINENHVIKSGVCCRCLC